MHVATAGTFTESRSGELPGGRAKNAPQSLEYINEYPFHGHHPLSD